VAPGVHAGLLRGRGRYHPLSGTTARKVPARTAEGATHSPDPGNVGGPNVRTVWYSGNVGSPNVRTVWYSGNVGSPNVQL